MPDPIERLNTALDERYQVEREIGEGGMATVYLARDLKHNRNVALKVLKPELAAVVGAERFLAEIETTANLQHPHILPLFDSGQADSFLFYVMPFVEGETLQERIQREKHLPVDEALGIATAIAGALQHAHDRGVIHRDIKPANILLQDGQPVVSDFGIALAVGAAGGSRLTETGLSVGTPFYMSPEQATGDQQLSPATDIYALAAMLYELLTGDPPYVGSTAQAVLGKIIQGAPVSATQIRKSVPLHVDAAIRKALERLPADRFRSARDFAGALMDPAFRYGETGVPGAVQGETERNRLTVAFAAFAALAAVAAVWGWARPASGPGAVPVARFESPFRAGQTPVGAFELTPDGSAVVYVGPGETADESQLWVRAWDDLEARPIPGTQGARRSREVARIAVSPDAQEVAFPMGTPGPLGVVSLAGGSARTVAESVYNVAWSDDDWLYFMRSDGFGLSRVRPSGSGEEILTELAEGEIYHAFAEPLPGGEALLFQVWRAADGSDSEIWSLDLATRERTLVSPGNNPRYAAPGLLIFGGTDGQLLAAPFDARRGVLTGPSVPVVEDAWETPQRGNVVYSVSGNGALLYLAGPSQTGVHEFVWANRSGEVTAVDDGETFMLSPTGNDGWRLSPDGTRIAFTRHTDGNDDVWVKSLPDGPVSRLTFSPELDLLPQWAPDGRSLTIRSGPLGDARIFALRADGAGEPELLFDEVNATKGVWSPDGRWLVIRKAGVVGDETARDILAFRPGVDSVAAPLVATPDFWEQAPTISRDGRWLAYSSNETGRHEIFVRPFPDVSAGKWQLTSEGGINPVWAHNGRELFFFNSASRQLRAIEFTTTPTSFEPLRTTPLFDVPRTFFWNAAGSNDPYDVALDDERFLMAREYGSTEAPGVVLVQNLLAEIERRMRD